MIKVSKNLKDLVKLLKTDVYLVGGYVRNALLGFDSDDKDIASKLTIEQVMKLLDGTRFLVKIRSIKMGTIEIMVDDEVYQHTTFRSEEYLDGGYHTPIKTVNLLSWEQDAKRRDFTINAIYYNIATKKICDVYGGVADLKNKVLKCVETPEFVFKNDGLRLLRLVRFACEFDFSIDNETYEMAKKYAKNLSKITGERKKSEIQKILFAENKYPCANLSKGLALLFELNLFKYIIKLNDISISISDIDFSPVYKLKGDNRFICFIICIYNFARNYGYNAVKFSLVLADKWCFNLSKNDTNIIKKYLSAFENSYSITSYKKFIFKYLSVIYDFCEILKCFNREDDALKILNTLNEMKLNNTPFSLKELKINGNDLKNCFEIENVNVGVVLNKLLKMCVDNPRLNNKKDLIKVADSIIKSL